jgi:hypothetical protein
VRHGEGLVDVDVFSVTAGNRNEWEVLEDDFEAENGWTTGGTAAAGQFVREDPHEVTDAAVGPVQPENDATGSPGTMCWVTGNPQAGPGFDPQDGDVDGGTSYIESPIFDGTGPGQLLLRFSRWFHRTGVAGWLNEGYYLARVSNDGGTSWTQLERLDSNASSWVQQEFDLSAHLAPTAEMTLHFEAGEVTRQPAEPLIELLIDDLRVFRREVYCDSFSPGETMAPNPVGPTLRVLRSEGDLLLEWTAPPTDTTHDPARYFPVYRSGSPVSEFAQVGDPTDCVWRDHRGGHPVGSPFYYLVAARNAAGSSGEEPTP